MPVHTPIERSGIYFIIFTCYKWLHLIEITKAYDEVYKFLGIPLPMSLRRAQRNLSECHAGLIGPKFL
jgi:hypothetical protein